MKLSTLPPVIFRSSGVLSFVRQPILSYQRDALSLRFGSQKADQQLIKGMSYDDWQTAMPTANTQEDESQIALHSAIYMNKLELVKDYLETGNAKVNAKDPLGMTPLSIAAGEGNPEMIKFLLEKNASLEGLSLGTQLLINCLSGKNVASSIKQNKEAHPLPFLEGFMLLDIPQLFRNSVIDRFELPNEAKDKDFSSLKEIKKWKGMPWKELPLTHYRHLGVLEKKSNLFPVFSTIAATLKPGEQWRFELPRYRHSHWIIFQKDKDDHLKICYRDNEFNVSPTDINQTLDLNLSTGSYSRTGYILTNGKQENEDVSPLNDDVFAVILRDLNKCLQGVDGSNAKKTLPYQQESYFKGPLSQGIPMELLPFWRATQEIRTSKALAESWYQAVLLQNKAS